jgi:hypothetical protein
MHTSMHMHAHEHACTLAVASPNFAFAWLLHVRIPLSLGFASPNSAFAWLLHVRIPLSLGCCTSEFRFRLAVASPNSAFAWLLHVHQGNAHAQSVGTDLRRNCPLLRSAASHSVHSAQTKERTYSLSGMNARRKDLQCSANSKFETRRMGLWAEPRSPKTNSKTCAYYITHYITH